ncbi:MAG: RNA polymerase sigma factor [Pseudomonadota bacterium]
MSQRSELNQFFAEVEKRAYGMALVSVKNPDDALDIVQDVMMTLVRKYAHKPSSEWRPLFYRILKNRITDWHRSNQSRNKVFGWLSFGFSDKEDKNDYVDPIEMTPGSRQEEPDHQRNSSELREKISGAVGRLPLRQQQAFMLRAWEGMDVKETARAMGCSSGSVKTHFSRAVHALRAELGDQL